MSIINSDQYNADWQLRVLRGLQGIIDELHLPSDVSIVAPLGSLLATESVAVALSTEQFQLRIIPTILVESGTTGPIGTMTRSISFASNGTADALVSFDGGATYAAIPAGTTVNMDAGAIYNFYHQDSFLWDTATNPGASLIITYNT